MTRPPKRPMPAETAAMLDPQLPPPLPHFEHINRYWDPVHRHVAAKLLPGEYYVTRQDEWIVTVLGSCVSACIRDPVSEVGGMNHFMLPALRRAALSQSYGAQGSVGEDRAAHYGTFAMARLIDAILEHGGARERLEVKLFGGGRVLAGMTDIGRLNVEFALRYLKRERLKLLASDLGDIYPRKVYYEPATGRVRVLKLRTLHNDTIMVREQRYRKELECKLAARGSEELE